MRINWQSIRSKLLKLRGPILHSLSMQFLHIPQMDHRASFHLVPFWQQVLSEGEKAKLSIILKWKQATCTVLVIIGFQSDRINCITRRNKRFAWQTHENNYRTGKEISNILTFFHVPWNIKSSLRNQGEFSTSLMR